MATEAANNFLSNYDTNTPIDTLWNGFKRICTTCLEQIPSRMTTKRINQPWANTKIKRYSRQKQRLYNRAMNTRLADDILNISSSKDSCKKNVTKCIMII